MFETTEHSIDRVIHSYAGDALAASGLQPGFVRTKLLQVYESRDSQIGDI